MTRVPITSPLAVLTTRTTQEHLMATHSTTDLKPGDLVQHPEHGYGVVLKNFPGVPTIYFAGKHGYENTTRGFTGWERVESTPPADEQNASATEAATYQCPWCSTDVNFSVALNRNPRGGVMAWVEADGAHTCPPVQPDEPTEFGAKATVAQADGHIERWLNMHAPPQGRRGWLTWDARDTAGSTPGQSKWADWSEIIQRGTVTLGWDE